MTFDALYHGLMLRGALEFVRGQLTRERSIRYQAWRVWAGVED